MAGLSHVICLRDERDQAWPGSSQPGLNKQHAKVPGSEISGGHNSLWQHQKIMAVQFVAQHYLHQWCGFIFIARIKLGIHNMINHIYGLSGMYFTVKLFSGCVQTYILMFVDKIWYQSVHIIVNLICHYVIMETVYICQWNTNYIVVISVLHVYEYHIFIIYITKINMLWM